MSDRAMQVCETHLYAEKEQVCPWCRIRELVAKVERLEEFKQMAEMEFRKQVKRGDEWQQKAERLVQALRECRAASRYTGCEEEVPRIVADALTAQEKGA